MVKYTAEFLTKTKTQLHTTTLACRSDALYSTLLYTGINIIGIEAERSA